MNNINMEMLDEDICISIRHVLRKHLQAYRFVKYEAARFLYINEFQTRLKWNHKHYNPKILVEYPIQNNIKQTYPNAFEN